MSYSSEITGLDLFTTPFRSQASMDASAFNRETVRSAQASQPVQSFNQETVRSEQRTQAAVPQPQPKPQKSSAQTAKPPAEQMKKSDVPEKSVPQTEKTKIPEPVQDQKQQAEKSDFSEKQPLADTKKTPEPPKKGLVMDMTSDTIPTGNPTDESDQARRKAHEAAEAKRKAEWEAKQLEKKQAEEAAIQKLQDMSDEEAMSASAKRVRTDVERITRRNMKECVAEHIQSICKKDPEFARRTMHPRKSMANCFKYINRMAKEYIRQEMEENDIQPDGGGYGSDIPDGLCYQWSEDYFNDPDVQEDQAKEEKFVSRPYVGTSSKPKKTSKPKKQAKKEAKKNSESDYQQMSLTGV